MRRRLSGLVLGAALAAQGAAAAVPAVELVSEQVGAHSYYVQGSAGAATHENRGFNANAGFVVTSEGVVVFDTLGTPALGRALLAEIRRRTPAPIRIVILSHYHADHAYGIPALRAEGADVWMHRDARHYLDSALAAERLAQRRDELGADIDADFVLPQADRWLDGDRRFTLGGVTFDLRHVGPAHAPDDMALLVVPDGVLFTGDIVFGGRIPFLGDADSKTWLAAMDRLDDPRARVLVPGHGPAAHDAAAALRLTRSYLADLRQQMQAGVAALLPFEDAYARGDWRAWQELPAFAEAHRANAYAVYLELEQESLQRPSG